MVVSSNDPSRISASVCSVLTRIVLAIALLATPGLRRAHALDRLHEPVSVSSVPDSTPACTAIRVALDSLGKIGTQTGTVVVLESLTVAYNNGTRTKAAFEFWRGLPGMASTTWENFLQRNTAPHTVCPFTRMRDSIAVAPPPPNYTADAWAIFRRDHPDAKAWVRLSDAGIGANGNQAFVVVEWAVHERGGARYDVLLNRNADGTWHVQYIQREQTSD